MNDSDTIRSSFEELASIGDDVLSLENGDDALLNLQEFLAAVEDAAREEDDSSLCEAARWFAALAEVAHPSRANELQIDDAECAALASAIKEGVRSLCEVMRGQPGAEQQTRELVEESIQRWSSKLELFGQSDAGDGFGGADVDFDDAFAELLDDADSCDRAADVEPTADEMRRLLSAIGQPERLSEENAVAQEKTDTKNSAADPEQNQAELTPTRIDDAELAEAFLDDACRCVSSIEESLLAYESTPDNREPLHQVCRELHTLKGASASVGLSELADYLHHVEDEVQGCCDRGGRSPDIDAILRCVDAVRKQMAALGNAPSADGETSQDDSTSNAAAASSAAASTRPTDGEEAPAGSEPSLRVKVTQVDRLMDMLAELVMLRNQRDSRVEQLKTLYGELIGCVSRVRHSAAQNVTQSTRRESGPANLRETQTFNFGSRELGSHSSSLNEVANDILEIARRLRELYEPVASENKAVSRFIGQFRHELVELRRVPVAGLFRRLHRSVRDAAKAEGKQVKLQLVGEQSGIDRSLQERLYEPLLHIVRNSVSHGIEDAEARVAAGKDATGTVTLEARGGANFLVIEIRDDGRGLDYDALRRRGLELGLLQPDRPASRDELAQLIFQRGFSTRKNATEISGRGVGMDVVAAALERLRSWIEVESTPGSGTTIRLTIPLRSVIEHAMIFRSGGQLFALPMKFLHAAGKCNEHRTARDHDVKTIRFSELLDGERSPLSATPSRLVIGYGGRLRNPGSREAAGKHDTETGQRVALIVDDIVGPDEVVMRPLPPLLRNQSLYAGVTLAGTGEIVLVFDTRQLIDRCARSTDSPRRKTVRKSTVSAVPQAPAAKELTALVVDDSVSARRTMSHMLRKHGFKITEAADGFAAWDRLQDTHFDLIVTDLEMPRLSGMDLLERIRGSEQHGSLPVIVASSRDEEKYQTQARKLGALTYLVKPVDEKTLAKSLERVRPNAMTICM